VRVKNKFNFRDLSFVHGTWVLEENGKQIETGNVPLGDLPPLTAKEVDLGIKQPSPQPGAEYMLTVKFELAQDTAWAPKGHVVAWDQFEMPFPKIAAPERDVKNFPVVTIAHLPGEIVATSEKFSIAVNTDSGAISSYNVGGKELLTGPLEPKLLACPYRQRSRKRNAPPSWHLAACRHSSPHRGCPRRAASPERRAHYGAKHTPGRERNSGLRLHHLRRRLRRDREFVQAGQHPAS